MHHSYGGIKLNKNDDNLKSIVDEYNMSMGGYFFNKKLDKGNDTEFEVLAIENALENHIFDTHQLLSIYDELSDSNKRELFRKVIVELIKFKFNMNGEK